MDISFKPPGVEGPPRRAVATKIPLFGANPFARNDNLG